MAYNEQILAEKIVNLHKNVKEAQEYIKKNFNIESSYNEDEQQLNLWTSNINESLQLVAAKDYINRTIGEEMVTVKYGK
jgi:hypothetical protein